MRHFFTLCLLLLSLYPSSGRTDEAAPSIELHFRDKQPTLPEPAKQRLQQLAMQLVESSNFHSNPGDKYHFFTLPGVQSDYRREIAGKFLLVSFSKPQEIRTIGGKITVVQIVIGLNRADYASSLFTIDDSSRIIEHTKYSGERCIQLFDIIKQITAPMRHSQ